MAIRFAVNMILPTAQMLTALADWFARAAAASVRNFNIDGKVCRLSRPN